MKEIKLQVAENGFILYVPVLEERKYETSPSIPPELEKYVPVERRIPETRTVKMWKQKMEVYHSLEDVFKRIREVSEILRKA